MAKNGWGWILRFLYLFGPIYYHFNTLKITKSTRGAGKTFLRHALRYPESMVRLRGICLIHPAELLLKNDPQNDPVAARFFYLPEKMFGHIRGHCKADLAETWGLFFGEALPVIRPGHFMSFTYREAKTLKPYIYIYIYIICPENTYYHRHTIPRKISARKKVSPGYTKYIRAKNLPA